MRWILLALVVAGCSGKKAPPSPPPSYPIHSEVVAKKKVPLFLEALGHVEPIISIELRSRVEGELTGVYFQEGQEVKKGDLLFTIDPRPYQASLREAEAVLQQNLATLALTEEKVKRYRLLTKDEFYAQIDYESLQANYAETSALVEQNRAQIERAKIDLGYCWIYAPIDGRMGVLEVDFGNLVSADGTKALAVLNQMDPIYVTFSIPEASLFALKNRLGLEVLATHDEFAQDVLKGSLFTIDNRVDPKTGMVKLKGKFDNLERSLWPGQFVRTRLILQEVEAVVIPFSAVQLTPKGPVVFVVKETQTVEMRKVKLGQREGEEVIVQEGLQGGERIAVEGLLNLTQGAKVYEPL